MAIIKKFRIKSFKNINTIIEFENISLSYGNRQILENMLRADVIEIDIKTKNTKIFMLEDNKKVNIKSIN